MLHQRLKEFSDPFYAGVWETHYIVEHHCLLYYKKMFSLTEYTKSLLAKLSVTIWN